MAGGLLQPEFNQVRRQVSPPVAPEEADPKTLLCNPYQLALEKKGEDAQP